jgi:hypothetical protein
MLAGKTPPELGWPRRTEPCRIALNLTLAFRSRSASLKELISFPEFVSPECGKEIWMKALTWHSKNDIRGDSVPDPRVTACAICGSDLRLLRMVKLGQLRLMR